MSKKKGSRLAKKTTTTRESVGTGLRMKDIEEEPSRRGGSTDGGIGSKCRRYLSQICKDDDRLKEAEIAYDQVVGVVDNLSDDTARVVCLAACSDFTFDSLVASAKRVKYQGTAVLGERDLNRVEAFREEYGDEKADAFKRDLLWSRQHKRSE